MSGCPADTARRHSAARQRCRDGACTHKVVTSPCRRKRSSSRIRPRTRPVLPSVDARHHDLCLFRNRDLRTPRRRRERPLRRGLEGWEEDNVGADVLRHAASGRTLEYRLDLCHELLGGGRAGQIPASEGPDGGAPTSLAGAVVGGGFRKAKGLAEVQVSPVFTHVSGHDRRLPGATKDVCRRWR